MKDDFPILPDEGTDEELLADLRAGMQTSAHATRRYVLGTILASAPIVLTARPGWAAQGSIPTCEILICLDDDCDDDDDDDDDDHDDDDHDDDDHDEDEGEDEEGYGGGGYGDDDGDRHRNQTGRGHDEHGRGKGKGHHKDQCRNRRGGRSPSDWRHHSGPCDEVVAADARNVIDYATDGSFDEPIYPTSQTGPTVDYQEAKRIKKAIRKLVKGDASLAGGISCIHSWIDYIRW
ncbi:MAG: hypothetical protein D6757_11425 [Alphaproteobacteria bacterium]|nr:MAG: hypothetical protein D6757_11425 [Alphaproteobacteria bacterium]